MPGKKISTELPLVSYEIVKQAAELKGSTLRSFAASAIVSEAIRTIREFESVRTGSRTELLALSPEDCQAVVDMIRRPPETCRIGCEKAMKMTESHRDIPVAEEDRL